MAIVYFLTAQKLKERTPINFNVDNQLISNSILECQDINIQQAIGSELYKKLKTLVSSGDITTSTDYKTLLDDYVIPALEKWSMMECLKFIRFKIMNKSVSEQSSDNSTPIDISNLKYLTDDIKNKAEYYTQRLIDYIIENESKYPEWSTNNGYDDIRPQGSAYQCGLVLDDEISCERFLGLNKNIINLW